ncbi:MAG: alpha-amylase family glycosyl hydrolase, partial [bacterium]|nr:alpha-amylase family glycosyl hydrolase [bacterium]
METQNCVRRALGKRWGGIGLLVGLWSAVVCGGAPSPFGGHWGPLVTNGGVSFRVWAPHATSVCVAGTFNGWSTTADALAPDSVASNSWSIFRSNVAVGAQYKFVINGSLWRLDPWSRAIAYSGGNANSVVKWAGREWKPFTRPHEAETVLYELHVGTFNGGTFGKVAEKARYLRGLGINAVQLMPPAEFGGDRSWGYNPVGIYAPEVTYGGYEAFREMVDVLHEHGIAVYVDVVYNHIEGEVLWKWDGWSMGSHVCTIDGQVGEHGGIFYYDWTGTPAERWYTPWGKNRPHYGRGEVTNYLTENLLFWLEEMNCDGIRMDSTINMRTVNNGGGGTISEALPMMRGMNAAVAAREPGVLMIAEDMQRWDGVTRKDGTGLGFDAQWNDYFVDTVRDEMKKVYDEERSVTNLRHIVWNYENGRPFASVKYSESHDEAANGQSRLNVEIDGGTGGSSYYAKKRSTLAGALALTAVGIPMLFQGQEFLEDGYFRDDVPLDWAKLNTYGGIWRLYRDLIHLRRGLGGVTRGLTGGYINVYCVDEGRKVMAWHRRDVGGVGDDVVVVINASAAARTNVSIGMPQSGRWYCHFNSDWRCYDASFGHGGRSEINAGGGGLHGQPFQAVADIPPYSCLIYSQAEPMPVEAKFSAWPTNGNRGLTVRFYDETVGTGTNWLWEFGDGVQSSAVTVSYTHL